MVSRVRSTRVDHQRGDGDRNRSRKRVQRTRIHIAYLNIDISYIIVMIGKRRKLNLYSIVFKYSLYVIWSKIGKVKIKDDIKLWIFKSRKVIKDPSFWSFDRGHGALQSSAVFFFSFWSLSISPSSLDFLLIRLCSRFLDPSLPLLPRLRRPAQLFPLPWFRISPGRRRFLSNFSFLRLFAISMVYYSNFFKSPDQNVTIVFMPLKFILDIVDLVTNKIRWDY